MFWFVGSEKLETRNPKLETATIQPLWKPPQPQSEQRRLIPSGSFFLFLPRLSGKTIFSESHSPGASDCNGFVTCYRTIGTTGTLERLEPALGLNGLNEAKRLNGWNDWNGSIPVMNEAKRLNPSIDSGQASWNDWNWLLFKIDRAI